MHTEINSFRLSEGMERKDKGGKPVLIWEHGCMSSLFDMKTPWYAQEMQTKIYYEM